VRKNYQQGRPDESEHGWQQIDALNRPHSKNVTPARSLGRLRVHSGTLAQASGLSLGVSRRRLRAVNDPNRSEYAEGGDSDCNGKLPAAASGRSAGRPKEAALVFEADRIVPVRIEANAPEVSSAPERSRRPG
jgi:hypothetical protein